MAEKILMIVYYVVYALELFFIGQEIFHDRVKEKKNYAAVAAAYLLIMIPAVLFLKQYDFILMILNIFLFLFLFQGSIGSRLIHFGAVYLLTNMVESLVFSIGIIFWRKFPKLWGPSSASTGEISLFFAAIITGLLLYIINRKVIQNFIIYFRALSWFQYLVIILIVWSGILLMGIIAVMPEYINNKKESNMLFFFTAIFMGTAFVGVILLVFNVYSKDYYLKQNQIKEEIIHVQQMYFQNIFDNDREMRRFRHDISSQLRCLGQFLAEGKTEDALGYLQAIGNHFEELTVRKYYTGNEILDIIINQKMMEIREKGIEIEFEGKMDKPDFMDTYDLCMIFSNMLDNGIEACEKLQDNEAVIRVSVLTHGNTVFFQFMNPATPEMYNALKSGRTTKQDKRNHGFGMKNVKRAVDRNGGEIAYLYREGMLVVEMYFEI
ncbi:MAG: GHKL domain-containing protein [Roseburia sp.]|nr:GHKL domain-containing protein [Roseburia sp.]